MVISVITLFPDIIKNIFSDGVIGKAIKGRKLLVETINPRDYAKDCRQSVDDRPYGGGPGMVMCYQMIEDSFINASKKHGKSYNVYLTPQGKKIDHKLICDLSKKEHLVLLCGRYEGVDERIIDGYIDLECSLGDFVLSGGELAASAVIDGVARLLPDALGNADSAKYDSFYAGLLDHPHYTRPELVNGKLVPSVLLSGDHKVIDQYRLQQSLGNSWVKHPELFAEKALSEAELCLLNDFLKHFRNSDNSQKE